MTNTKAPEEMTAQEALEAYGYVKDGDTWGRPTYQTQMWVETAGGFYRVEVPTAPMLTLEGDPPRPWGRAWSKDPRLIQVPWKATSKFEGVSGLHPDTHPEAFEWTWPAEVVAEQYAFGYVAEGGKAIYGRRYKRDEEGKLVQDRSPNPQNAGTASPTPEPEA